MSDREREARLAAARTVLHELPPADRARVLLLDEVDRAALLGELCDADHDLVADRDPELAVALTVAVTTRRLAGDR